MNMKNFFTIALSLLLCFSVLVGCSSESNVNNSTVANGPEASEIVLTFKDQSMSVDAFRFYVFTTAMEKVYSIDPKSTENILEFDWNQTDKDGKVLKDVIIDEAIDTALLDLIMIANAKENGVTLTAEEEKAAIQSVESSRAQTSEDVLLLTLNANGISNMEVYKKLAINMSATEKAKKEISANISKYIEPDLDLKEWKNTERVTAQHVLIGNDSEKFDDPQKTAQEVLKKAKAGEDFLALMKEYNEDPGETDAGYTFGHGEMVPEFEEAAFALECDEISDVVKTDYGYHVIRRYAGLGELQNYWVQNEKYNVNKDVLAAISIEDIMRVAGNAQKELSKLQPKQTEK